MKSNIQLQLHKLWGGTITHLYHNFLNHCLTFIVQIVSNSDVKFYKISVSEISTIIFDEPNIEVTEKYEWSYMGMTSIDYSVDCTYQYYPDSVYDASGYDQNKCLEYEKRRSEKKIGAFNLLMEINETAVYIRAKRLKINDKEYELL